MSADIDTRQSGARLGLLVLLTAALAGCGGVEPSEGEDGDMGDGVTAVGQSEAGLERESEVGLLSSASQPRPSSWSIESVTTGGSGCPDGEVDVVVTPDQRTVLLTFSAMHLEYPPPPRVKRLNCVAGFSLKIPAGLQVGIAPVLTTGYADLSAGARVRLGSQYFIAGSAQRVDTDLVLEGPHHGRYVLFDGASPGGGAWISESDRPPAAPTLWSGCGGSAILTVNTSVTLNTVQSPAATAVVNTAGAGGAMQKVVQLVWKACS